MGYMPWNSGSQGAENPALSGLSKQGIFWLRWLKAEGRAGQPWFHKRAPHSVLALSLISALLASVLAPYSSNKLAYNMHKGFPGGSDGKESTCDEGDLGSIPGLGRSPGEKKGYPLQYSRLENSVDCPWGGKELDTTEWLSLHFHLWFLSVKPTITCELSFFFPWKHFKKQSVLEKNYVWFFPSLVSSR